MDNNRSLPSHRRFTSVFMFLFLSCLLIVAPLAATAQNVVTLDIQVRMYCDQIMSSLSDQKDITWGAFQAVRSDNPTLLAFNFQGNIVPYSSLDGFSHTSAGNSENIMFASGAKGVIQTFSKNVASLLDPLAVPVELGLEGLGNVRGVDMMRESFARTKDSFNCSRGYIEIIEYGADKFMLELSSMLIKAGIVPDGAEYAIDIGGPLDFLIVTINGFHFYRFGYNNTAIVYSFVAQNRQVRDDYLNDYIWAVENLDYSVVENELLTEFGTSVAR